MKCIRLLMLLLIPCFSHSQDNPLYVEPAGTDVDRLRFASQQTANDTIRMAIFRDLSLYYLDINTDSSLYFIERSLPLAQKLKLKLWQADIWDLIALNLRNLGNYPRSLKAFNEGLKIAESRECEKGIWDISHFTRTNDPEFARLSMLATIQSDMVELYAATGNFDKESEMIRACFSIAKKIEDYTLLSQVYRHFGQMYTRNDQLDSALIAFDNYFASSAKAGFRKYSHLCYNNIGNIYLKKNLLQQALGSYHSALRASKVHNTYWGIGSSHVYIAKFYNSVHKTDSALYHAKAGLNAFIRSGQVRYYNDAYNTLVSIYKNLNMPDSALLYLETATVIRDSLTNLEKIKQFHRVGFEEQLRIQELEKEKIETRGKIRSYSLIAGLGVIFVVAFILYRNNVQKQKANTKLENTLANLKAAQAQLIQSEKMASLGELTAGIAHEIQNPLNFVNNFSEVSVELIEDMKEGLRRGDATGSLAIADDIQQNLEKINHHGKRADAIVKGMLEHSRAHSGDRIPTDINALADEYLRLAYHGLRAKDKLFNADLQTIFDPTIGHVNLIPQEIGRVMLNLINNALYAVNERSKRGETGYKPIVRVITEKNAKGVGIRVEDNGDGIPEAIKAKVFQPFFTTKPTGQGTGLGLSLAYDIVKAHGGTLTVESKEGKGCSFLISVPS